MQTNLFVSYCYSIGSAICFRDGTCTTSYRPTAMHEPMLSAADIETIKTRMLADIRRAQPEAHGLVLLSWMWLRADATEPA